jgi:sugar phosphate isomerase/epimerase
MVVVVSSDGSDGVGGGGVSGVGGRVVSLAAGVIPELADDPAAFVAAAGGAGWPACGVWFAPDTWEAATTARVLRALDDGGLVPLDIEVVRLGQHDPRPLVDAGGELGVRNVLAVSFLADRGQTVARFAELCELAEHAGMRACLEFMPFSSVGDLPSALAVVTDVGHPAGSVLVDTLHLARSGGSPDDLATVDRRLLPYVQWCDAAATIPDTSSAGLIADALDGRCCPGTGDLPVSEFLDIIGPDVPLSLEVRSAALRTAYRDPLARASAVLSSFRSPRTSR